jgi:hypothetical protein
MKKYYAPRVSGFARFRRFAEQGQHGPANRTSPFSIA